MMNTFSLNGTQEVAVDVTKPHRGELRDILLSVPEVLATNPWKTNLVEHSVSVGDVAPIKQKSYWVP